MENIIMGVSGSEEITSSYYKEWDTRPVPPPGTNEVSNAEIQIKFDRKIDEAKIAVTNELSHIEFPRTATPPDEDTLNGNKWLTSIPINDDVKSDNKFLTWFNNKYKEIFNVSAQKTPITEAPEGVFSETFTDTKEKITDKPASQTTATVTNPEKAGGTAATPNTENSKPVNTLSGLELKPEDIEKEMAALNAELGIGYSEDELKKLSEEAVKINEKIKRNSEAAHAKGESGTIHETEKRTGLKALSKEEKDAMMEQIKNGIPLTPEQIKKLNDDIRLHETDLKANDKKTIKKVQAFLKNHPKGVSDEDVDTLNTEERLCFDYYHNSVV